MTFNDQEKQQMNAKAKGIAKGMIWLFVLMFLWNFCSAFIGAAHAANPENDQKWNDLTEKFRAAAEKQMPDGSFYTRKCDHKVRHYCFRMMEMVNSEGYLITVTEFLDEEETGVWDRMTCKLLNKERTYRKCVNFDTGSEVYDRYIKGKWVLVGPPA